MAVSVYKGNTNDAKTVKPLVEKLRKDFALERVVLVGDRGMIGQELVEDLRKVQGLEWITALKSSQIRALVEGGALQLGLFDEKNLFELSHPDYPGERLVACRNLELGKLRGHRRQALVGATLKDLEKVRAMVKSGKLRGAGKIGVRAGRVINKYKVASTSISPSRTTALTSRRARRRSLPRRPSTASTSFAPASRRRR